MPLFELSEYRHLSTEKVLDIAFTPAYTQPGIMVSYASPGSTEPDASSQQIEFPPSPSLLSIELSDGEYIQLEGDQAEKVWAAYSLVCGVARAPTVRT